MGILSVVGCSGCLLFVCALIGNVRWRVVIATRNAIGQLTCGSVGFILLPFGVGTLSVGILALARDTVSIQL